MGGGHGGSFHVLVLIPSLLVVCVLPSKVTSPAKWLPPYGHMVLWSPPRFPCPFRPSMVMAPRLFLTSGAALWSWKYPASHHPLVKRLFTKLSSIMWLNVPSVSF